MTAHFGALARSLGKTAAQAAIAWVLAHPEVACALTGPRRLAHLEENLGGSGWRLPAEALAGLEALFAREDAALAAEEAATVDTILDDPLPPDPTAALRDLVYAVETAVSLGRAAEDAIRPAFFDLWPLQERLEGAGPALERIRARLQAVIPQARP